MQAFALPSFGDCVLAAKRSGSVKPNVPSAADFQEPSAVEHVYRVTAHTHRFNICRFSKSGPVCGLFGRSWISNWRCPVSRGFGVLCASQRIEIISQQSANNNRKEREQGRQADC